MIIAFLIYLGGMFAAFSKYITMERMESTWITGIDYFIGALLGLLSWIGYLMVLMYYPDWYKTSIFYKKPKKPAPKWLQAIDEG